MWERGVSGWPRECSMLSSRTSLKDSSLSGQLASASLLLFAWQEKETSEAWQRLSSRGSLIKANYGDQRQGGSSRFQTRSESEACGTWVLVPDPTFQRF